MTKTLILTYDVLSALYCKNAAVNGLLSKVKEEFIESLGIIRYDWSLQVEELLIENDSLEVL